MNKLNNEIINQDSLVVYIPFDGFYESILSESLDFEIEQMIEEGDVVENYFDKVDFRASYLAIANGYAKQWLHLAGLEGKFVEFFVPRFFNYDHEQIGISFDKVNLDKIKALAFEDENNFSIFVKENCKSRDGFISAVDNDLSNWGDNWANNQYFIALLYLESENNHKESVVDYLQGNGGFEIIEL